MHVALLHAAAAAAAALLLAAPPAHGAQWYENEPLWSGGGGPEAGAGTVLSKSTQLLMREYRALEIAGAVDALKDLLEAHPDLTGLTRRYGSEAEHVAAAPTDFDVYEEKYVAPAHYVVSMIVDPCRGYPSDCCHRLAGPGEYVAEPLRLSDDGTAVATLDTFGVAVPFKNSRVPDLGTSFDHACRTGDAADINASALCNGPVLALDGPSEDEGLPMTPPCFDRNATGIDARNGCAGRSGVPMANCVAVGYASTAYIAQCGGEFAEDNHCGTFLELHLPGKRGIISQTKLTTPITSGYATTVLPLTWFGDTSRIACEGPYEIWWVQRTRFNFVIQLRKRIRLFAPKCEFEKTLDLYQRYTSV